MLLWNIIFWRSPIVIITNLNWFIPGREYQLTLLYVWTPICQIWIWPDKEIFCEFNICKAAESKQAKQEVSCTVVLLFKKFVSILWFWVNTSRTLKHLLLHLQRVSEHRSETGMSSKNLAIVWTPNLLRDQY